MARLVLQRLDRQTPDRSGNSDCSDNLAAEIMHRHCRTTHFVVELTVVESNARAADILELPPQALRIGDRLRRQRFQLYAVKIAVDLIRPQGGKYDFAQCRAVGRPHDSNAI